MIFRLTIWQVGKKQLISIWTQKKQSVDFTAVSGVCWGQKVGLMGNLVKVSTIYNLPLFTLPCFFVFYSSFLYLGNSLLILDYRQSPNNISISIAPGLTCFFLKEIARIPPLNMVFIRNKHLLAHEKQIKQPFFIGTSMYYYTACNCIFTCCVLYSLVK